MMINCTPTLSRSPAIDIGCLLDHDRAKRVVLGVPDKLTYMHENPVRAGPVRTACDWPFSSARYYDQGRSVGVPIGWSS